MRPGEALRRSGEDAAGALLRLAPSLLLDPAQGKAGLTAGIDFDFVEQRLPRLGGAQGGDSLQLGTPAGLTILQYCAAAIEIALAGLDRFPPALQLAELCVQRLQPVQNQIWLSNRCRVTSSTTAC